MFLIKVYRYNKWLFTGMLLFAAMQLFVFYRPGMVFSPWYNYGMYSGVIKPGEEYAVYRVYADGVLMKGNEYTPQQWDAIQFGLTQADATACNDHFYDTEIRRLFNKFHLPAPNKEMYINTLFDAGEIKALFASHLAKMFGAKNITVVPVLYVWSGKKLVEKTTLSSLESNSFQCK